MADACPWCANNCHGGCSGSCQGCTDGCSGCGNECSQGCINTCKGTCKDSCTGSCETGCQGTCAKIASLQLGGNKKIDWENFSIGEAIIIKAEDWNNVANGFKNYIKQAAQSSFPKDKEVEIDLVSPGDPITAELYNQLFLTLYGSVPSPLQPELDSLGEAIENETIITAKHFSIIGEIFNSWSVPQE